MSTPKRSELKRRAAIKISIGYDRDIPRCATCSSYMKPVDNWICGRHKFPSSGNAVCDNWAGKDGSVLERA